ncbi:MAG: hypothetical protein M1827_006924 [Pycnora praestabilis]|nr:MAG: hypothetical protein M1827_006924 [Pycnora praestabilis]
MPGMVDGAGLPKRKRGAATRQGKVKKRVRTGEKVQDDDDPQTRILLLESRILESRRHYNNIAILLESFRGTDKAAEEQATACVALCRVFCRLMVAGSMSKTEDTPENEAIIIKWLKERYNDYTAILLKTLQGGEPEKQSTVLILLMRLVKDEALYLKVNEEYAWLSGMFADIIRSLLEAKDGQVVREEFVEKYVEEYDDIRLYTFAVVAGIASEALSDQGDTATLSSNILSLLSAIENIPTSKEELEDFYVEAPKKMKHRLYSLTAHKKQAQEAWLALLRMGLSDDQRNTVLGLVSHRIAPWFLKVEMLMDFLTDSYNVGGSTSLLALSGLFYLIQEKNLDYPQFYQKLYSLLDSGILHSKHRSRFFRLLDTFLSSTHLPAALVASFIKRLSRLLLHAPPPAIVVVVPWIYNLLKRHPSCTFMIHRAIQTKELKKKLDQEGMDDPFNMSEQDPMQTHAIESSLWEVEMLQSHYHPNVATLAKIISEQFTKNAYNLEDFLDHSYGSMLDAELSKDIKKAPAIEYEIPKKILTKHEAGSQFQDSLLVKLWNFTSS